jgi:hypothetical protein
VDAYERTSPDQLVATWSGDDGDGVGRLTVTARSNGFGGTGRAWFDRGTVLEFASSLTTFPLPSDGSVALSGGMGGVENYDEHVGLVLLPLGPRGQVDVRCHLANETWPGDPPEVRYETRVHVLTTYERLTSFASGLRAVVEGMQAEAHLGGERLD